jgi:myo-inositol 2-dehydrogenase/D-chiro-inositol 1-dehydrogenase
MRQVTLGAVGAGRIGKLHTENILRMPGVRVKVVADPFIDEDWARDLGLATSPDPEVVFSDADIDAVLIFSPSTMHADQIIAAAQAGKHIFCEKPIALEPERIREALAAVAEAGVKLQIGFNRRFDPEFLRLKEGMKSGEVGRLHLIRITARDPALPPIDYVKTSGGMFLDMTIHDFDMVRYLSDSEVKEVYATGAVMIDPAIGEAGDIDTAITTMKLENGALAVIDNSRQAVYGYDQRIEVFGSKGSMEAGNRTPTRTVLTTADGVIRDKPLYFFLERYMDSFQAEMEEFIQALREDREPTAGGKDGLASILIGIAANESMETGNPVSVSHT